MTYTNLLLHEENGVAEIVINRHDIRNALAPEVRSELVTCLEALRSSEKVRAIVLTGTGSAFSAGGSIRHFKEQTRQTPAHVREELEQTLRLFQLIPRLDKPIIAAVNGYALGGGCGVAISCDITIASDRATFGFPEITRGFVPALVSVPCLQRVGMKKALELLLGGETVDAAEAVRLGLANRVVAHDDLMPRARAFAQRLVGFSPNAMRTLRQLIFAIASPNYEGALFTAREVSTLMRFSEEFAAGADKFLSGRTDSS